MNPLLMNAIGQGLQQAGANSAGPKGNAPAASLFASLDGRTISPPPNYGNIPVPERNPRLFRDLSQQGQPPTSILPPPMQGGANQTSGNGTPPPMPQQGASQSPLVQALMQAQVGKEAVPDWLPSNTPWPYR